MAIDLSLDMSMGSSGAGSVPETFNVINGVDNVINGVDNVVATV